MSNIISKALREELIVRHRTERDGRVRDRIKAVLMYDDGYDHEEIAQVLLLSQESIRKHIRDFLKSNKLKPENGGYRAEP